MSQQSVWEAAREYAARGWRVAPAALGVKHPSIKEWQKHASCDPNAIADWFPPARVKNICIVTGRASGLWVLDVDTKLDGDTQKIGDQTLAALVEELGPLPVTLESRTWSGGRHLLFDYEGIDFEIRNTVGGRGRSALGKDLDVRGDGGQIVAPPSAFAGQPYQWINDEPVAHLPAAWIERLRPAEEAPAAPASTQGNALDPERLAAIGQAALDRAVLDIGIAQPGERNEVVNSCAYTVGRLIPHGCLTEAEAVRVLTRACDDAGHDRVRTRQTVASGLSGGQRNPKSPWPPPDRPLKGGRGRRADAAAVAQTVNGAEAVDKPNRGTWPDEHNDSANADLFVKHARGDLLALSDRRSWAYWNGQRWTTDAGMGGDAATRLWVDIASDWQVGEVDPALFPPGEEDDLKEALRVQKAEAAWRKTSLMASGVRNCLSLAQSSSDLAATMAAFDGHLTELNTPGGIIDLNTGAVRASDASAMHSQITYASPANGIPTKWLSILHHASGGDDGWIEYLQTLMGYSMTGVQTDAVFPFLQGLGGAGKSIIMNTFGNIMGDYAGSLPSGVLMAGPQKHDQVLARLNGKRFVRSGEVHEKDRFDEQKLRMLTGGDEITANFMRENSFEFTPTHHLWMHGNDLPRVATGGEATWRRMKIIPFVHPFPEALKEKRLVERMVATEGGQILTWAMEGAQRYLSEGLSVPATISTTTEAYRAEEDDVSRFMEDNTERTDAEGAFVSSEDLYEAFNSWSVRSGVRFPMDSRVFGRRLAGNGYEATRKSVDGRQQRGWKGLILHKTWLGARSY